MKIVNSFEEKSILRLFVFFLQFLFFTFPKQIVKLILTRIFFSRLNNGREQSNYFFFAQLKTPYYMQSI
jgi:hypothetical protein